jgi:phage gp36-like protein
MYCSLDDIKETLPERIVLQLVDDNDEGSIIVDPPNAPYKKVVSAINSAETLINGYMSGRYTLPFDVVPDLIKLICVNLAICNLYERNHEAVLPEAISEKRKANIKTLERLQDGTVTLPGQKKEEPATFIVNKGDNDRTFSEDLLGMY